MNSNFFTNEENNTLKNKINNILQIDKNIEYLDFLIGYFRITGFNKISDNLSSVKHTRILVGINADKNIFNATQLIKKFSQEQVQLYNEEPLELQEYQNFESMKQLIVEEKIEVRISANRDVHSKMYIMRSRELANHQGEGKTYRGSVIIGSSNLTHNGLEGNTEINAELNQERDIIEAVKVFEKLWAESVELTEDDFDIFITPNLKEPPKDEGLTPYKLYIKLLIEHFGNRIDFMDSSSVFVPKEYKKLSYQVEAVNDGIMKLKEHNGFFLSDVVGLGKTVVVAMLIKKLKSTFKKRVLIVIPPAVRTQWEDTFNEFNITCCDVVSLASLHKVKASAYELVVVDESHKFKNSESKRYKQLYEICLNKKVILLSATPQNNTPSDLYNQIALFQNVKNSTLSNCKNLQIFFTQKEIEYKNIINNLPIDEIGLKRLSEEIRDNVLRTVMIRRTRYDIQHHDMYKVDIEEQGLSIPKVNEPIEHEYLLKGELGTVFDETAIKITQKLNYSRFNSLSYLTKEAQVKYYPHESPNIFEKNPLSGLMKTLLIKRFESSFSAFKISIGRHLKRYETFMENFENDIIYLGEKATDILDYDVENDEDYDKFIENLKENGKVKQLVRSDFKKGFEADLKSDYEIFKELVSTWKTIEEDPKLEKFKEVISKDIKNKIVIFTESVDTLNYLKDKLPNIEKILFITSQNRDEKKHIIQKNFDANYDKEKQRNDYNIIITTDTLAEGINLHRSSIVYNYDIPWNATKLIQRIGRVNRIGTRAKFIDVHNFKPASHIDKLLELSQKAFVKLQSSHTMMGEDNQIYTKDEKVSSVNLFESYKQESLERDEELDYLEELRTFREENPSEFKQIKELEEGLNLTRRGKYSSAYVVLDIDGHKNYVYVDEHIIKPIGFIEVANALKATSDEVALKSNEDKNQKYLSSAIAYFEDEFKRKKQDKAGDGESNTKSQKAEKYLKEWLRKSLLTRELFKEYRSSIRNGVLGMVAIDEINQLYSLVDAEIKERLVRIVKKKKIKKELLFDETLTINYLLSELFIGE
jgi:superfamily II DNA/RNA helicase